MNAMEIKNVEVVQESAVVSEGRDRKKGTSSGTAIKKLKVDAVASDPPSSFGNSTDPDQLNPKSVLDEGKKQVQPDGSDISPPHPDCLSQERSLVAPVSENQNGGHDIVYNLTENESRIQDLPTSPSTGSLSQKLNVVIDQVGSEDTPVLSDRDVDNVSSHPLLESVPEELESLDILPIEISSDESENEADEDNCRSGQAENQDDKSDNEHLTISDSDEEQEDEETVKTKNDRLDLTIRENRRKLESLTELHPRVRLSKEQTAHANDFEVLYLIGKGAFGRVVVVRKENGYDVGRVYAMKVISKIVAIKSLQRAKYVKSEREVLEAIQGTPFIVCLQYAFQDSRYLYLVMNFVQGGDMYRRLHTFGTLPKPDVILYVAEMVVALEHLHERNILYGDLKLENVLIDGEGHIVLADLGLSIILTAENQFRAYNFCGTVDYMAPEVIEIKPEGYGKAVDWWSLGVITVEMLSGKCPFTNLSLPNDQQKADTERRILHEEPQIPSSFCPTAVDLVKKLLVKDPIRRMDASGIREHPFFKPMDWSMLRERSYQMPFLPRLNASDDVQNFDPEYTNQPGMVPDCEPPPCPLEIYKNFEYTAPQILDSTRMSQNEGVEDRNPNGEHDLSSG